MNLEHIHAAFQAVQSGADFPRLVRNLHAMGVVRYDNQTADGRTDFYGTHGQVIHAPAKYPALAVAATGDAAALAHALDIHQAGETDYFTFCEQAAAAGVDRWTTHMEALTVTYLDRTGKVLRVEVIPG
jgi:uncharacterized protein YbcV (DUF1398 family)